MLQPIRQEINRIRYFTDTKKVSAEKIVLGVPFYADDPYTAYSEIANQSRGMDLYSRVAGIMPLAKSYAGNLNDQSYMVFYMRIPKQGTYVKKRKSGAECPAVLQSVDDKKMGKFVTASKSRLGIG